MILNCPHCNPPLATTKGHKIVSLDPLTIETPTGCAETKTPPMAVAANRPTLLKKQ